MRDRTLGRWRPTLSIRSFSWIILMLAVLLTASPLHAADLNGGWGNWWLPPDRSKHGPAIDSLFTWIFWITMITFIGVETLLVYFLIKYRYRPGRKAFFIHGNTRLEMAWTIAPAIILALLALFSKKVWDDYRYSDGGTDKDRAIILVIGQQFKWNVIYPGPDGKLGKYLIYPRPSDATWPTKADGTPFTYSFDRFQSTKGPADMPYETAVKAINAYIDQENPLGKVFDDPDGLDDDWSKAPGREIYVPVNRNVEVQLSSKDVIHDFFLPNFRVKLDAVPGMRGVLYFKPLMTSASRRKVTTKNVQLADLGAVLSGPGGGDAVVVIDETAPGSDTNKNKDATGWRYVDPKTPRASIIRNNAGFGDLDRRTATIAKLKDAGVTEVKISIVEESGSWELACAELCGQGHSTMKGTIVVLDQAEYKQRFETRKAGGTAMAQ